MSVNFHQTFYTPKIVHPSWGPVKGAGQRQVTQTLWFSAGSAEELHRRLRQEAAGQQLRHADQPHQDGRTLPLLQPAAEQPTGPTPQTHGTETREEEPGAAARGRIRRAQLLLTDQTSRQNSNICNDVKDIFSLSERKDNKMRRRAQCGVQGPAAYQDLVLRILLKHLKVTVKLQFGIIRSADPENNLK